MTVARWLRDAARSVQREYAGDADRPLAGYVGAAAVYLGITAAAGAGTRLAGRRLPLRAPFTRFAGVSGEAELAEEVRGTGARHAVGELLTCPFCVGQWVATAFVIGLAAAPHLTRAVAAVFAVKGGSDFLQNVYDVTESVTQRAQPS